MKKFKKIYQYIFMISVVLVSIYLLKPFVDDYKEKEKYDFRVSTIDGELSKSSFKGKVLAVYFGYTFCPDICPTSLSSLALALDEFSKEKTNNFRGLFISVDPKRDELGNLKEYASYFHKNFEGATSSKENIDDIVKRYGSSYEKVYLKDSKIDYSVSHTSYIYIFDKDGSLVEKIGHFSDIAYIKSVLEKVL